jgi:hypothetical protein
MADDLDNLIRAAMKTLDEQVPSGYFETLPNLTLARLEGSMQHQASGTTETRETVAPPPIAGAAIEPDASSAAKQSREEDREDSGLHDIRNLAQSTKQRLSSRRITTQPIAEDVLASSSGSFKNIALPQPARMVSLPELDELPSKAEVVAAEKAAKKVAKEKKAEQIAPAVAVEASAAAAAPAVERKAFSLPSQQRKSNKGLFAVVGIGLAAAAGAVIYMQVGAKDKAASTPAATAEQQVAVTSETTAVAAPVAGAAAPAEAQPAPPPAQPAVEAPKDEGATGVAQIAADAPPAADKSEEKADGKAASKTKPAKGGAKVKLDKEEPKEQDKAPEKADKKADANKKPDATKTGDEGEPSFDALLKEAGVTEKKEAKPKLEKKSLTSDDFKKGMSAVLDKAKACYSGTQGTAMVKLTIAPTGQISKVTVSGEFSGKPEGACVASALKGASFPPWDGGPQSFTYAVLLSD